MLPFFSILYQIFKTGGKHRKALEICLSFRYKKPNDDSSYAYQQLEHLLKYAAVNVNAAIETEEETPLHLLCRHFQNESLIDLIKLLMYNGADVNSKASLGWTPLHYLNQFNKNHNLFDIM